MNSRTTESVGNPDAANLDGREMCVIVGLRRDGVPPDETDRSLDELENLADTAGARTVARVVQFRKMPDPATFVGGGKAREIAEVAQASSASLVIFDDDLKPGQQSNLSDLIDAKVLDRTGLILDIFAQHAHSSEGKLQVELAQQKYRLSRLTGRGNELSRLGGGIGTRGPGEQKLEVDRRRIRDRISHLERELKRVERSRSLKRKRRIASKLRRISLVGYTNAGKSTLMNQLTASKVLVQDKLFSTLDPSTGRLQLPHGQTVLISDTVGFVNKLPHQLVEAFRSTLDEVGEADLLLHVVDSSAKDPAEQMKSVREVVAEIGADNQAELVVANKIDQADPLEVERLKDREPGLIGVSARTGEGIPALIEEIEARFAADLVILRLRLPYADARLLAQLYAAGEIISEDHGEQGIVIEARVPVESAGRWSAYLTPQPSGPERREA